MIEFGACETTGVRTKTLKLVKETEPNVCPKEKLISKRCKNGEKKNKDKRDRKKERLEKQKDRKKKMEEKCRFGAWGEWADCSEGKKQRSREITKGSDAKIRQRKAIEKSKC